MERGGGGGGRGGEGVSFNPDTYKPHPRARTYSHLPGVYKTYFYANICLDVIILLAHFRGDLTFRSGLMQLEVAIFQGS